MERASSKVRHRSVDLETSGSTVAMMLPLTLIVPNYPFVGVPNLSSRLQKHCQQFG